MPNPPSIECDIFVLCSTVVEHFGGAFSIIDIVNAVQGDLSQIPPPLRLVASFSSEERVNAPVPLPPLLRTGRSSGLMRPSSCWTEMQP